METQMVQVKGNSASIFSNADFARKVVEDKESILCRIDNHRKERDLLQSLFFDDPFYGFDWSLKDFFRGIHVVMPSQSYGTIIQRRIARILGLTSLSNRDNGDYINDKHVNFELKSSYLARSISTRSYNFMQVRPWAEIGHIFVAIDPTFEHTIFFLNSNQLMKEIEMDSSICHGGTELKKITLRISGKSKSTFDRWLSTYRVKSFEELKGIVLNMA